MPNPHPPHIDLLTVAKEVMRQHGFDPEFAPAIQRQLADLRGESYEDLSNATTTNFQRLLLA